MDEAEKKAQKRARRKKKRQLFLSRIKNLGSMVRLHKGELAHDDSKSNILIVAHEASRTGAPILADGIARILSKKYNVVVLALKDGEILPDFISHSSATYLFVGKKRKPEHNRKAIHHIAKAIDIKFAIVNSIESRATLEHLNKSGIPNITLVHEFAAYTPDQHAPEYCVRWSDKVIYSADVVKENSLDLIPDLKEVDLPVIPQGKSSAGPARSTPRYLEEKARLSTIFRPEGFASDTLVIMGAGTIDFRKGVDLFLMCASRIAEILPEARTSCRFIWVGSGYKPDSTDTYSRFLADQISRSGLEHAIEIVPATPYLPAAFELADIFLLSSRLDPLPNVTIDALSYEVPVFCFEKTTGIAQILTDEGVGDTCVAPYLNIEHMSQKIAEILQSREKLAALSHRSREIAEKCFDMENYVGRLEQLCIEISGDR